MKSTKKQKSGKPEVRGKSQKIPPPKWDDALLKNDKGEALANQANVTTILRFHPNWVGVIAFDLFAETIVKLKPPPWDGLDAPSADLHATAAWGDADEARTLNWLQRSCRMTVKPNVISAAVLVVADANATHPVRNYFDALEWDGKPRLDAMFGSLFGTEDTPYTRGASSRWMISAVARVYQPGAQVDHVAILESPQGWGKTSGLRALVPNTAWYADTGLNIGDKDSFAALHGVLIYGFDELDSIRRAEKSRTKNFVTQTKDHYRPPYGGKARDFPRQNVFVATTNEDRYLIDLDNRRYWPVRLERPTNVRGIEASRDQLWAEAVARYKRGEKWHPNEAFGRLCEKQQRERVEVDVWEEPISTWLAHPIVSRKTVVEEDENGKPKTNEKGKPKKKFVEIPYDATNGVLMTDVFRYALGLTSSEQWSKASQSRIELVLKKAGYARGKLHREAGSPVRRWELVTPVTGPSKKIEKKAPKEIGNQRNQRNQGSGGESKGAPIERKGTQNAGYAGYAGNGREAAE